MLRAKWFGNHVNWICPPQTLNFQTLQSVIRICDLATTYLTGNPVKHFGKNKKNCQGFPNQIRSWEPTSRRSPTTNFLRNLPSGSRVKRFSLHLHWTFCIIWGKHKIIGNFPFILTQNLSFGDHVTSPECPINQKSKQTQGLTFLNFIKSPYWVIWEPYEACCASSAEAQLCKSSICCCSAVKTQILIYLDGNVYSFLWCQSHSSFTCHKPYMIPSQPIYLADNRSK